MDKLNDMTLGEKVVAGSGVLMLIAAFLPWWKVSAFGFSASANAFDELFATLAVIVGIAMAAIVLVSKLGTVELPEKLGNLGWGQILMIGGIASLALVVIQWLKESDFVSIGLWLGLLSAIGLAFGGFTINKERSGASTV